MVYSIYLRLFVLCLTLCYFVLVFFNPFSIAITLLGKRELILVLFVRLLDLRLFDVVCFLFLLVSGKGCGLWLWHSLDFSITFFGHGKIRNLETARLLGLTMWRCLLQSFYSVDSSFVIWYPWVNISDILIVFTLFRVVVIRRQAVCLYITIYLGQPAFSSCHMENY